MSLYYADGLRVFKSPVRTETETGASISLGFPVCTVTDWIGEEGAKALAEMLCIAEQTQQPSEHSEVSE